MYVATDGSDLNEGTLNQPFATITKARDVIRDSNKQGKNKSYKVVIREGTYYLPETFLLTSEDSGKDSKPVIFTNYDHEKVTISGSPAFDIGFKEFALDRFGLTQHFKNIWVKE